MGFQIVVYTKMLYKIYKILAYLLTIPSYLSSRLSNCFDFYSHFFNDSYSWSHEYHGSSGGAFPGNPLLVLFIADEGKSGISAPLEPCFFLISLISICHAIFIYMIN